NRRTLFRAFFLITPPPPRSTLFPYTTLFRSNNLSQALLHHCQMFDRINTKGDTDKTIIYRLLWEPSQQDYRATRLMPIEDITQLDRKSTRLNSSHVKISYAVFCLKKKIKRIH